MPYYNEHDPKAAEWLRNLCLCREIPYGDVDSRDVQDVRAADLGEHKQCHFFAGIGGWAHALELAGWSADQPVWSASLPCQPFSPAGEQLGTADERHLWPVFRDLVEECEPSIVFGEQVASKPGRAWLASVQADLEALGYITAAADMCAAGVGAPHIRQRLYWVAYSQCPGRKGGLSGRSDSEREDQHRHVGRDGAVGGIPDAECARLERSPGETMPSKRWTPIEPPRNRSGSAWTMRETKGDVRDTGQGHGGDVGRGKLVQDATINMPKSWDANGGRVPPVPRSVSANRPRGRSGGKPGAETAYQCSGDDNGAHVCVRTMQENAEVYRGSRDMYLSQWDDVVYLPCADDKARPIKPGLKPLVNGLPGRVGLLRGYGNAIVPQVAAVFIRSVMEAIPC